MIRINGRIINSQIFSNFPQNWRRSHSWRDEVDMAKWLWEDDDLRSSNSEQEELVTDLDRVRCRWRTLSKGIIHLHRSVLSAIGGDGFDLGGQSSSDEVKLTSQLLNIILILILLIFYLFCRYFRSCVTNYTFTKSCASSMKDQ
jgi:hypothetical protein